jgi:hypothetical protein
LEERYLPGRLEGIISLRSTALNKHAVFKFGLFTFSKYIIEQLGSLSRISPGEKKGDYYGKGHHILQEVER